MSGERFDDYIEQHIFTPLGMQHSSFRQPLPPALLGQASLGYPSADEGAKGYEIVSLAPAGSLASTGADMGRFLTTRQWFDDPADPFHRGPSVMTFDRERDALVTQDARVWIAGLGD